MTDLSPPRNAVFLLGVLIMDFMTPEFFSAVGFPAAICIYTLFGVNKTMKELTIAINQLTTDINKRETEHAHKLEKLENEVKSLKFKLENIKNARS